MTRRRPLSAPVSRAGHYSYNYRLGEVIGAVSVSIPMVDLYHDIGVNLESTSSYRGIIILPDHI